MANLTERVTRGAAWTVSLRVALRGLGLVSTLILVRILDPVDFGIVAMAMVVVAGIELFSAFGFDITLIQNQNASRDDYDTAWTLTIVTSFLSGLAIALLAYPAARLYDEPRLVPVFQLIALASVLTGLRNIGLVEFRKQLQLEKEFVFRITVKLIGFVVTISTAFWLRSYWALIIGIVTSRFSSVVLSYLMQPYRPKLSLASFKTIFRYSKWLFLNNLMQYLRLRSPDFIVGKVVGVSGLGLYSISYEISQLPTTELVAPVNRVLLPGLAQISSDMTRLRDAFVRAASTLVIVSLPTAFGLAVTAHLFTPIALGEKWLDAIPLINLLAIYGGVSAILSPVGTTLLAIGRPATVAMLSGCNLTVFMPLIYIATVRDGVAGTVTAMTVAILVFLPIYYFVAARLIDVRLIDVLRIFIRPTISTLVMFITVDVLFGAAAPTGLNLILAVLTGAAVYTILIGSLWTIAGRPSACGEAYLYERLTSLRRRKHTDSASSIDTP